MRLPLLPARPADPERSGDTSHPAAEAGARSGLGDHCIARCLHALEASLQVLLLDLGGLALGTLMRQPLGGCEPHLDNVTLEWFCQTVIGHREQR